MPGVPILSMRIGDRVTVWVDADVLGIEAEVAPPSCVIGFMRELTLSEEPRVSLELDALVETHVEVREAEQPIFLAGLWLVLVFVWFM